jgi:hypothetical protein
MEFLEALWSGVYDWGRGRSFWWGVLVCLMLALIFVLYKWLG